MFLHPKCTPKRHIVFSKTHKTGSSALQNVFFRFALKHELTLVLPKQGHLLNYAGPIRFENVLPPLSCDPNAKKYDMLVQHAVFDYDRIAPHMHNDSVYVTILRDPAKTAESNYNYFSLKRFFNVSFNEFMKDPENHLKKERRKPILHNLQAFDLGLPSKYFLIPSIVNEFVNKIDKLFDLVMIYEYFWESLILLQELLLYIYAYQRKKRLDTFGSFKTFLNLEKKNTAFVALLAMENCLQFFNRSVKYTVCIE